MNRVHIEEHAGQRIVMIDFRNCTPEGVIDVCEELRQVVTAQPPKSVHTLADFSGAQFDRESFQAMKETAAFDRPHTLRSAFIGVETLPDAYHKGMQNFSARRFAIFKTRQEALAYLTQNAANEQTA